MELDTIQPELEPRIEVRLCTEADLPALDAVLERSRSEKKFQAQQEGKSSFLIALYGDTPVGHLDLLWDGDSQPEIRQHIENCPELSGISVWPPEMRSHGIGRKLIESAEAMVKSRDYSQVGLAVEVSNERARQLYERLGYKDWGHGICYDRWTDVNDEGNEVTHNDPCYYLIKPL